MADVVCTAGYKGCVWEDSHYHCGRCGGLCGATGHKEGECVGRPYERVSMRRFRKLPVLVEAHQWDGTQDKAEWIVEWVKSLGGDAQHVRVEGLTDSISISTLEGEMHAVPDDWVIRGTRGEFYPCKPGPFADTFEEVDVPL